MDQRIGNGSKKRKSSPDRPYHVTHESFEEKGWWGSRPRALQALINAHWKELSKADRYVEVRRWYVADKGVSTAEEIAALLLGIAAREPVASTQG